MPCSLNPSLGFSTPTKYGGQMGMYTCRGEVNDKFANLTQFNLHMSGTMQKVIK